MADNKRFTKSEKYTGVYQRKNGTWFFRYKRIMVHNGKPEYHQMSGFETEELAYKAMQDHLLLGYHSSNFPGEYGDISDITFGELFQEFLKICDSESTREKYQSLYDAQLTQWKDRDINTISNSDIDILLLRLSLLKLKPSYQRSFRNLLKRFFKYANEVCVRVTGDIGQTISTKPYKLRVLSLFSGIGAPEQALKDLGVDFELVNFCEINDDAAEAYCLLHNVDESKRIVDVNTIDKDYCFNKLPNIDLMVFGFPCTDVSIAGKQEGIVKGAHPTFQELVHDNLNELTRSGLFYRALQIAFWKKPKIMIAENVSALVSKKMEPDFLEMVKNLQDAGYNIVFDTLDSKDYGIPQSRKRVFMVMIRDDLNISFKFPEPQPQTGIKEDWLKDWLDTDVNGPYYVKTPMSNTLAKKLNDRYDYDHKKGYINCITTSWGVPSYDGQSFVKDEKGIRCLTSEELMRFQGFPAHYGTILRENKFAEGTIGELVGNSITVKVLEAIFSELVKALNTPITSIGIPSRVIEAQINREYTDPLFAYMGNKSELIPFLTYLMPENIKDMTFVDMFAGSATVAINSDANRVIINEKNPFFIGIYKALSVTPAEEAWEKVMEIWNKYNLCVKCDEVHYSCCPELKGISKENIEKKYKPCDKCKGLYEVCRDDYNKIPFEERVEKYWYWGLALVYHSFNTSWVKHNSNNQFTSPFGSKKVSLNKSKRHFFEFVSKLQSREFEFCCQSYNELSVKKKTPEEQLFYYLDPPYFASEATYNEGWGEIEERALYEFLDECDNKGIYWMLSNVTENNGRPNDILKEWLRERQYTYNIYYMKRDYSQSSFNRKNEGKTVEVAVTNYRARQILSIPKLPKTLE